MDQTESTAVRTVYDLIVIGGGAAGLMAAGRAAQRGMSVVLLEKMEKGGRKVRISGKGRCNLTNMRSEQECMEHINGDAEFFLPAYRSFDNRSVWRFFERMGVRLVEERGGRVFPKSGNAWDVADALVYWCRDNGVEIWYHTSARQILTAGGRVYGVKFANRRGFERKVEGRNVLLATGGVTYPLTGSTGDGYIMADALGHSIVPLRPALVPLQTSHPDRQRLEGLHLRNVQLSLEIDGQQADTQFGEMSFSGRGVEGAVTLRMSRRAVDALIDGHRAELLLDLKPALSRQQIVDRIDRELAMAESGLRVSELLRKLLPPHLVPVMARAASLHPDMAAVRLDDSQKSTLADCLKCLRLPISDYGPAEAGIVTAGGVSTGEVDPLTMASRKVRGLYFAGEILDLDASTGGYNLQIAFSTGHLAGELKEYVKETGQ